MLKQYANMIRLLQNYLISKCLGWVVNNNNFGEIPSKNTKVFYIFAINTKAMFSKQTISTKVKYWYKASIYLYTHFFKTNCSMNNSLDPFSWWIQEIQNFVCVYFLWSCEQNDFKHGRDSFQKLFEKWSRTPINLLKPNENLNVH